jgi:hypothetical protein
VGSLEADFIMEDTRRWSVESKGFEMMIKGGALGVRIVEKSKKKQRSIFIQRDELAWLVEAVNDAVDRETSEVFWDQSRAGYIRLIVQKCSNRHGRFLIIEEFDGRRRIGTILIPEGRYGQGWARLISELQKLSVSLWKRREIREKTMRNVVSARRSFAEVVGQSKPPEEATTIQCGGRERVLSKTHSQTEFAQAMVEPGECSQPAVGTSGELEGMPVVNQWTKAIQTTDKNTVANEVTCSVLKELEMRREKGALNAIQELGSCRAWLRRLKGEIDAGLRRFDAAIKVLEACGPGQESNDSGGPIIVLSRKEPKGKNILKPGTAGMGPVAGPKLFKPKMPYKQWAARKETPAGVGQMARPDGILGPHGPGVGHPVSIRNEASGSGTTNRRREPSPISETGDPAKSVPGGSRGELGLNAGSSTGEGDVDARGGSESVPQVDPPIGDTSGVKGKFAGLGRTVGPVLMERSEGPVSQSFVNDRINAGNVDDQQGTQPEGESWRIHSDSAQKLPSRCPARSEPPRAMSEAPARGPGTKRGDKGLLNRPEGSWVAGRTGFGPVNTGKVTGRINPVAFSETGETSSVLVVAEQNDVGPAVDRVDEDTPGGEGEADQVFISCETTAVTEAYRRRFISGVEDSEVEKKLNMSMEVSTVTGLSCDGQEGLKKDCLRRIIVEKHEIGRGDCSVSSELQQEEDNLVRDGGNCSDYEA